MDFILVSYSGAAESKEVVLPHCSTSPTSSDWCRSHRSTCSGGLSGPKGHKFVCWVHSSALTSLSSLLLCPICAHCRLCIY